MSAIASATKKPIVGIGLDWALTLLGWVFVGGLFLDGWAHRNGQVDQSFFTPWHAVLYSGFFINFLALAGVAALNISRGATWRTALPAGYGLSLLGLGLWFIGGPGDLAWHTVFGIEENLNALYSPTHLLLATGLVLAVSGPWRASWLRADSPKSLAAQLPIALSLSATLSVLTFFLQYAHPVVNRWGMGVLTLPEVYSVMGTVSLMVIVAITMGHLLLASRRWTLAFGFFSLVLGLNATAMAFLNNSSPFPWLQVAVFVLAGLAMDVLYRWLKPTSNNPEAVRLFATVAPLVWMLLYFSLNRLVLPFNWSIHMVGGMVVIAGFIGLALSLLIAPPKVPGEK